MTPPLPSVIAQSAIEKRDQRHSSSGTGRSAGAPDGVWGAGSASTTGSAATADEAKSVMPEHSASAAFRKVVSSGGRRLYPLAGGALKPSARRARLTRKPAHVPKHGHDASPRHIAFHNTAGPGDGCTSLILSLD